MANQERINGELYGNDKEFGIPENTRKSYTVSEYNHPFPNQYGAEGQLMLRSYGAFQGWDGVFEYTFNHRNEFDLDYNNYISV